MKVIDHEPQAWFLLEDSDSLFLDGNYSHSFFGYDWMIQLSDQEVKQFRQRGREFIDWLTNDIQNSAPVLEVSKSSYKTRRVPADVNERAHAAVKEWQVQRGGSS